MRRELPALPTKVLMRTHRPPRTLGGRRGESEREGEKGVSEGEVGERGKRRERDRDSGGGDWERWRWRKGGRERKKALLGIVTQVFS